MREKNMFRQGVHKKDLRAPTTDRLLKEPFCEHLSHKFGIWRSIFCSLKIKPHSFPFVWG